MIELNERQFEEFFYAFYDRVYAGLLAKSCPPDVAQELTQLTFIKVWEYRSSFSFDIPPEAQIFKKARQVFIDWLRKEAHQRKIMEEMQHLSQSQPPTKLELTDTIQKAVNQLPLKQKTVFWLSYAEGYSRTEIAEQLGISIKTVDRHIHEALKQLRKTIAYIVMMVFISQNFN